MNNQCVYLYVLNDRIIIIYTSSSSPNENPLILDEFHSDSSSSGAAIGDGNNAEDKTI
jgi:hypothetical protein